MKSKWLRMACIAMLMGAGTAHGSAALQDPARFHTSVTGVAVHVLVRQNGRAITDLKPGELVLTDSGVRQELTAIAAGTVPIDVSLAIEQTEASTFLRRAYASEMAEVLPLLADGDRLRLVSVGEEVREIVPLSAKGARIDAPVPIKSTWAALYDALAFLFVRPGEPGRQHVVIL